MSKQYKEEVNEFQSALHKLIYEYDTANWENRFVVGGVLEILFCALLNSIGFNCRWLRERRYDIEVNNVKFSLKSNFTGIGSIRLINILGDEVVEWEEPTIFFISNVGICYADPKMGLKTKHTHDALIIDTRQIIEAQEWIIPLSIPRKPKGSANIKTASYDVAKSILEEINSRHLKHHIPSL